MNKWLYRAVGVASGALLLSSGVAHAESANEAKPTVDPQAMHGLLADLFKPTGGQHHLGLSIDTQRASKVSSDAQARTPEVTDVFDRAAQAKRNELLPVLGLLGNGGLLSSLTGGGGKGLLGGLPIVGDLASGLPIVGGLAGADGPLGALTGADRSAEEPNTLPALTPAGVPAQPSAQQTHADPGLMPAPARAGVQGPGVQGLGVQGLGVQGSDVQAPDHVGRHRAPTDTIRPVVADPEYAESASLPIPIPLVSGDALGTLPVTSLVQQLPLIIELPLIGELPASLEMLRTLPVLGMLTNLVPVESGHIA